MRLAWALALALGLALGGCASRLVACPLLASSPGGATPFCVVTSDGWAIQGVTWNEDGSRTALLVHGLNEDHHSYDQLALALANDSWRVVALDSRGMGESQAQGNFRNFTATDFAGIDRDLDAAPHGPTARLAVVGASVGSSEALRWAARVDVRMPLVLLSPGLSYQGMDVAPANRAHAGPILYYASNGDAYAAQSVAALDGNHPGPHTERFLDGALHGTQMLTDPAAGPDIQRALVTWLDAAVSAGG